MMNHSKKTALGGVFGTASAGSNAAFGVAGASGGAPAAFGFALAAANKCSGGCMVGGFGKSKLAFDTCTHPSGRTGGGGAFAFLHSIQRHIENIVIVIPRKKNKPQKA